MATWPRGYVATWPRGYVATWLRGYVATWPRGYVATWLRGHVATWPPTHMRSSDLTLVLRYEILAARNHATSVDVRNRIRAIPYLDRYDKGTEEEPPENLRIYTKVFCQAWLLTE